MTETDKGIRLSKAVKEFNLSTDHIIDFLAKKGISVDGNPNGKLPGEAYTLLQKEFQSDKIAKEEALQVSQSKAKKEASLVLDAEVRPKTTSKREEESDEILIKNVVTAEFIKEPKTKKEAAPEKEKVKEKEKETVKVDAGQMQGPTIVGKVDIDSIDTRTKPDKKKKTTSKKEAEPIKEKQEEEKPAKKTTKTKKKEADAEAPVVVEPVKETAAEPVKVEEPKIEKEESPMRIAAEKLSGPTVLRTIELPVNPPKKKPVASSSTIEEDRRKKKRKRTERPERPGTTGTGTNTGTGTATGTGTGQRPAPGAGQNRFQQGGGRSFDRGKRRFDPAPKPELTDKQIQDQIKQTLARLSGGGKTKSSKLRKAKREERAEEQAQAKEEASTSKVIKVTEFVSANELAKLMDVPVTNIISTCMSLGMFVSINQRLDAETLTVVAEEFGFTVEFVSADVQDSIKSDEDKPEDLLPRAPIVTVMGHVDHGKTSLLDYIRKANVIAGEAGGITQHIGAYEVTLENGKKITFLDTPGHEAFTAMRARGAKVTDIAIIVIAADDSVMPQTVEAINHAQAAGVPIVFALNKVDKPDSNPDKIREQLSAMNILVEEWGGKYQSQEISAKKGTNIDSLLEKVLLEAEILDLKANANRNATGTIIESSLDKGRGYVTTVLVQRGTLKVGDVVLAGCHFGRVKALFNERGQRIEEAGPSAPALLLGMQGAPQAGDLFNVMDDEREAKDIATKRLQLQREQGIRTHKHITLDEIGRRLAVGNFKELNVIVKGDVDGSIEALADSLLKLSNQEIQINVIHKSVGQITESDVLLASASNAIIIGFQVRPSVSARKLAEQEEIDIRLYSIIYNAINELKAAIEGMLAPEFVEKITGNIEVREIFKIPKVGTIAGCMVLDGKVTRNTKIRVVRDGIVVHTGDLSSLKRFKDDVKEVTTGYECGLSIANFNNINIGDIIEGFEQVAVKRTLA